MDNPVLIFLASVASLVATVIVGLITAKGSLKTKVLDIDAQAYERAERINNGAFERLEKEVEELKGAHVEQGQVIKIQGEEIKHLRTGMNKVTHAFGVAMNFIEQFLLWERDGSRPPRPHIPGALEEYLDPALIREHIRQQDARPKL